MEPLKLTINPGLTLTITLTLTLTCNPNPGSKIRKAVITAAGFNPGLFPAMKAVKPELFPVVNHGKALPAILLNVEQILSAGIEKASLKDHVKQNHFFCQLCDESARLSYYEDYSKLYEHFKEVHYAQL